MYMSSNQLPQQQQQQAQPQSIYAQSSTFTPTAAANNLPSPSPLPSSLVISSTPVCVNTLPSPSALSMAMPMQINCNVTNSNNNINAMNVDSGQHATAVAEEECVCACKQLSCNGRFCAAFQFRSGDLMALLFLFIAMLAEWRVSTSGRYEVSGGLFAWSAGAHRVAYDDSVLEALGIYNKLRAVRAFCVISMVTGFVCFCLSLVVMFCIRLRKNFKIVTFILHLVAAFWAFLALVVFNSFKTDFDKMVDVHALSMIVNVYSWAAGFYFALFGGIFFIISCLYGRCSLK
eukprot:TRINITY_DN1780_c0_g1_i1.p1 TRINITY_DN1780_c0_g1~~TRINITY_DN1780_c0_g1_i1.p1  ORF type:complete len:289 (-),score=67.33 TRINITY_DN1780_c0_g1_i1:188-1054(-)